MKLVKEISTNEYKLIEDSVYTGSTELYIDRTDNPTYWYNNYKEIGISYFKMRLYVKDVVESKLGGFNDFRDHEKDVLGILYLGDTNQLIPFYMSYYGYTIQEASIFHTDRVAMNVVMKAVGTTLIARSPKIISVGTKYLVWGNPDGTLNTLQANNFTAAISGFLSDYREYAYLGLNYGEETDGIMDYIESTGSYSSGGLKNYVFSPTMVEAYGGDSDLVRLAMAADLKDIFVNGNI